MQLSGVELRFERSYERAIRVEEQNLQVGSPGGWNIFGISPTNIARRLAVGKQLGPLSRRVETTPVTKRPNGTYDVKSSGRKSAAIRRQRAGPARRPLTHKPLHGCRLRSCLPMARGDVLRSEPGGPRFPRRPAPRRRTRDPPRGRRGFPRAALPPYDGIRVAPACPAAPPRTGRWANGRTPETGRAAPARAVTVSWIAGHRRPEGLGKRRGSGRRRARAHWNEK
jgi:hypothetical protein